MRFLIFICLTILIFSIGCKKVYPTNIIHNDTTIVIHNDTTIIYDTTIINNFDTTIFASPGQYRYQLPSFNTGDSLYITEEVYSLQRFNIDYYPGVDSVFYTVATSSTGFPNGIPFEVDLYDITDNMPIPGTLVKGTASSYGNLPVYFQSGNFASSLPHKEITLGIRSRFNQPGYRISILDPVLYLYKK